MPPRPVRSKPELVFPPCLTCGKPVEYTLTFEGRALVPTRVADQYDVYVPEPGDPNRIVRFVGDETDPHNVWAAGLVDVGGAPDKDMIEAFPCTCVQHGELAHAYLVSAINLTYPDVVVEVIVTVPADFTGTGQPSHIAARTRMTPAELRVLLGQGLNPVTMAIADNAEQVRAGLPETIR